MKRQLLLFLVCFLFASSAAADQVLIIDTSGASGRYYLRVDVGEDGQVSVTTLQAVEHTLTGGPTVPPPVDPPPPDASALTKVARDALSKVTDNERTKTARVVGAIYQQVADFAAIMTVGQLTASTNSLYQTALRPAGKLDGWKPWKEAVDKAVKAAGLDGLDDYRQAWRDIAKGLTDE